MATMKLRFDPSLPYQQEAIQSVTDLFVGMPLANATLSIAMTANTLQLPESGLANAISLDDEALVDNLHAVQERNGIAKTTIVGERRFAIEMETGTGKTYVYLRTIFELHKLYGLKKFVIVVPSIPIREGVLHSIETMREHFESLYNEKFEHFVYDSSRLTQIRSFATANTVQIMVINIQAFIKDIDAKDTGRGAGNVIYREFDKLNGMRPIEYIQQTRPVVIVDEPQRVQADKSQQAIARLEPSFVLEYSATFESPQKVYRLGPIEAYEQKLVKQIEVASVQQEDNANAAYVKFIKADITKQRTQVEITAGGVTDPKRKNMWLKQGDDLGDKSGNRPEYGYGYRVTNLGWEPGNEFIEFNGGHLVMPGTALGEMNDDVMKAQIRTTIRQHFERELELNDQGIKVLSLFFIDRVANYRDYDEAGNPIPGKIARWFDEEYAALRQRYPRYAALDHPPVERLHDGYFSIDNHKRVKDTTGTTKADDETYELIMRDKERLLSLDESLRFIFSHSALREGWDNPNVFQICTLNETKSVDKKRQEIGRGLRLPVNQQGERIHDPNVNRLTVVANESYREFAETLQREYEQDAKIRFGMVPMTAFNNVMLPDSLDEAQGEVRTLGQQGSEKVFWHLKTHGYLNASGEIQPKYDPNRTEFELSVPQEYEDPAIVNQLMDQINKYIFKDRIVKPVRERRRINPNRDVLDKDDFLAFWHRIAQRTRYMVDFDTEELVHRAAEKIRLEVRVTPPRVRVHRAVLEQTHAGVREGSTLYDEIIDSSPPLVVPDIVTMIQGETNLTRKTISRVLVESGRAEDIRINPQSFITQATAAIQVILRDMMQRGLKYEKREGDVWQVRNFWDSNMAELERFSESLYEVENPERTVYDCVEFDSRVESQFVKSLDSSERVKYYVKLPSWFTVDTPIGSYNPDWAIMMQDGESFYLVRETKSSLVNADRRGRENDKIFAARRHFEEIGVNYDVSTSFSEVEQAIQQMRSPV
jgi:type III restriction enzyme